MATRTYDGDAVDNNFITATNWSDDTAPVSADNVGFPAMAQASTLDIDGSDQVAVLLVDFHVEPECALNFGSRAAYLQIDTDYLYYDGEGKAFFDIDNSTEIWLRNGSAGSSSASYGFSLIGTSNALLMIDVGSGNSVGLGAMAGESLAATIAIINSGDVTVGDSLTCTTFSANGGTVSNSSDVTTMNVNGGTVTQVKNKPTTLNVYGGKIYYNSADVPTTLNLWGGILDTSQDARAKTFDTVNYYGGTINDPNNILTITTMTSYTGGVLSKR